MSSTGSKRVAKNAVALTLRMVLVTIVGLFTSRVVLQVLGVYNYGIYGVIGGVVGIVSFLNVSMAQATSRFLTFELGKGNSENLRKLFSTALIIHIVIAVLVIILSETIGLWFVNNKMNFPPESMLAVNVLYQFSIFSVLISFTQVPYSACIMAHEKMSIYAYFEIIVVVLKLLIVYALLIIQNDRLIVYGILTFGVQLLSAIMYRLYCLRHFPESHFSRTFNRVLAKDIFSFAGFNLYGVMCVVVRNQSTPILLNIFFGVVANAAASIVNTVVGAISGLTASISQAFRPQIIKNYAIRNIPQMECIMLKSVQFTLLALSALAIPVIIETSHILFLWLGQVPEYSVDFLRLVIISLLIDVIINTNNTAIHATGEIKKISFYSGTLYLIVPIVSYLILKYWIHIPSIIYGVNILLLIVVSILSFIYMYNQIPVLNIHKYIINILRTLMVIVLSWCLSYVFSKYSVASISQSWLAILGRVVLISGFNLVLLSFFSWFFVFSRIQRQNIISEIKLKLKINNRN